MVINPVGKELDFLLGRFILVITLDITLISLFATSPLPAVSRYWFPPSSLSKELVSPIGSANNLADGVSSDINLSPVLELEESVPSNKK